METTLAIIKPDGMPYRNEILKRIHKEGFHILQSKILKLSPEQAADFYKDKSNLKSYVFMVLYMSESPLEAIILTKQCAIKHWNCVIGPEKPTEARCHHPCSLRAAYGSFDDNFKNAVHGSENTEAANFEIRFFFSNFILEPISKYSAENICSESQLMEVLMTGLSKVGEIRPPDPIYWLGNWILTNNPLKPIIIHSKEICNTNILSDPPPCEKTIIETKSTSTSTIIQESITSSSTICGKTPEIHPIQCKCDLAVDPNEIIFCPICNNIINMDIEPECILKNAEQKDTTNSIIVVSDSEKTTPHISISKDSETDFSKNELECRGESQLFSTISGAIPNVRISIQTLDVTNPPVSDFSSSSNNLTIVSEDISKLLPEIRSPETSGKESDLDSVKFVQHDDGNLKLPQSLVAKESFIDMLEQTADTFSIPPTPPPTVSSKHYLNVDDISITSRSKRLSTIFDTSQFPSQTQLIDGDNFKIPLPIQPQNSRLRRESSSKSLKNVTPKIPSNTVLSRKTSSINLVADSPKLSQTIISRKLSIENTGSKLSPTVLSRKTSSINLVADSPKLSQTIISRKLSIENAGSKLSPTVLSRKTSSRNLLSNHVTPKTSSIVLPQKSVSKTLVLNTNSNSKLPTTNSLQKSLSKLSLKSTGKGSKLSVKDAAN